MAWRPDDVWSLGFRGSASQRAPEGVELFARGPHEATGTFEIGDADADEETSYTAELSVQANFARFRGGASAFYTYYDDFIFGELQGQTVNEEGEFVPADDDEALDLLRYTTRDAVFYGTELWAEADLLDALWGGLRHRGPVRLRARALRRLEPEQERPAHHAHPMGWRALLPRRLRDRARRLPPHRGAEQNKVGAFDSKTDSFTMIDASATVRISLLEDRIPVSLTVAGQNLNDVRGRNAVAFNKDEVLLPGRSVRVGIRAQF